ncbi:MAG: DivIVA domain-containing protein [Acidimicrobiia bacterium]
MDVTPQELRGSEIKEAWRGYHRDEVDELLERAAVTIEGLSQQLATASSRPAPAPAAAPASSSMPINRDDAEMLQRTLLLAQRAADDAVNEAQAQARALIEESEARAQTLVGEAEATARRIAESERRRLEGEILELSARRDALKADADALEDYASSYRDRVRAAIEADLDRIGTGTIEAPTARPELSEIETPTPTPEAAPAAPTSFDTSGSDDVWSADEGSSGSSSFDDDSSDAGFDTKVITIDSSASSHTFAPEPSPSSVAAPPRPESARPESARPESARSIESNWPPEPEASAAPTPGGFSAQGAQTSPSTGVWLAGADDWAASDPVFDDTPPWEQSTAAHQPFTADVPMEANAIDGDSLDDDAFFASLRDAVRDDEPLGPRDDEPNAFFDDDATDDRRRFRRRR